MSSKRNGCQDEAGEFESVFELIVQMLTWDPGKRITANDAIKHTVFDRVRSCVGA